MADVIDDAQAYNAIYQDAAFKNAGFNFEEGKQSPALAPETHPDFDGVHCVVCDADIHPVRLSLGKVRCTACQEALDKQRRMLGITGAAR